MSRSFKALAVLVTLASVGITGAMAGSPGKYPHYDAALRAQENRDCKTVVGHLNAYLRKHSYIRDKYREHYEDVRLAISQCTGSVVVRGVEDGSLEIDPLPDHPPMAE